MFDLLDTSLEQNAYVAWKTGQALLALTHNEITSQIRQLFFPSRQNTQPLHSETVRSINKERERLIARDWQEAQEGIYPVEILFDSNVEEVLQAYLLILQDLPQRWQRMADKAYQDFSPEIAKKARDYPQYYFRNFHFQTDGYLSERSAQMYDLQVELLFAGSADAMRRRILAPLKSNLSSDRGNLLDVGCGTGRSLQFLQATFPRMSYYGIDLSEPYLQKARQKLAKKVHLTQGKGEELPYADCFFTAVTSTFLFHELPRPIRKQILTECYRVLKPGGILVLCDSLQSGDIPVFDVLLDNFVDIFHEPFHVDYMQDNFQDSLQEIGFEQIEIQTHWASKYWIARKC